MDQGKFVEDSLLFSLNEKKNFHWWTNLWSIKKHFTLLKRAIVTLAFDIETTNFVKIILYSSFSDKFKSIPLFFFVTYVDGVVYEAYYGLWTLLSDDSIITPVSSQKNVQFYFLLYRLYSFSVWVCVN